MVSCMSPKRSSHACARLVVPLCAGMLLASCGTEERQTPTTGSPGAAGASVQQQAKELGCEIERPRDIGNQHVGEGDHPSLDHEQYSSDPPTSGPHYGTTVRWGFYDRQVQDEYAVHNLEHGGIVSWYGGSPDPWKERFEPLLEEQPKLVASPRRDLGDQELAMTAWGVLLTCRGEAVEAASDDDLQELMSSFVADYVDTGSSGEGEIPPVVAGTRRGHQAEPGATELPEPPRPVIDSTQEE